MRCRGSAARTGARPTSGSPRGRSTSRWPANRDRVVAGTLTLDRVDESADADRAIFDPLRLVDGIEPSEDPILHFRPPAYSVSYEHRAGAG